MAKGPTHRGVGAVSGGGYAGYRARHQAPLRQVIEICGGVVGGTVGGALADQLEPAVCGGHRRIAHSVTAGVGLALASRLEQVCARLRTCAAENFDVAQDGCISDADRLGALLSAVLCLLSAGFLSGLLAGYLSHLVLDGFTPAGLPLI